MKDMIDWSINFLHIRKQHMKLHAFQCYVARYIFYKICRLKYPLDAYRYKC